MTAPSSSSASFSASSSPTSTPPPLCPGAADAEVIDLAPVDGVYRAQGSGPAQPVLRPDARFLRRHPAHWIALGFGAGLSPLAPGTVGTLWGWLAFLALQQWLGPLQIGLLLLGGLLVGWWACTLTARHLGVSDPGSIVWDEILAIWLVLWLVMPAGLGGQLVAFLLFRYFDAAKPGPVAWADKRFKGFGWRGGLGILLDDLVAAFCTLLVIALWRAW